MEQATSRIGTARSEPSRKEWELAEQVAELETQLGEHIERERIRELELLSLRRELEVRFAYNATLEQSALERQRTVDRLESHIAQLTEAFASESQRAAERLTAEQVRAAGDLLAAQDRTAEAITAWQAAAAELAAERARVSYRLSQRLLKLVGRGPAFGTLRRLARLTTGRL